MTTQTIPGFTGKIQSGLSETKQQKQQRLDFESRRYAKRLHIDRINEQRALDEQVREVWE